MRMPRKKNLLWLQKNVVSAGIGNTDENGNYYACYRMDSSYILHYGSIYRR